ncbi:hypothetical protein [Streptomyces sp. NPDC002580]|uniref:hypothetical protein n=1 Tax=Streptomyces sp. NPDC002580 TaxID=3364653 RepID=UPI0036736E61
MRDRETREGGGLSVLQGDDLRGARLHLRRRLDVYAAHPASACDREDSLQVRIDDISSGLTSA